ncbi:DUF7168 domain-containing protein [Pseudotabrizicola algicola]|uniref:DUF2786 domain-containing protein n=1 Tax=Pseudotabrizicola algicola TaxID=2709381 RepID=A0A6B3RQT6_9RHOB|nr:DUF2786 domain-containing protein [Pseudotabrizicola algicola]NEX47623.1 DUF2786 domain-containing protein [Pseudotabrizicola algicola]
MTSDNIKQKIAALLKMTTAAGCTEAEALAAAQKAAALMRDYGLSEAEVTIGQASVSASTKGRSARDALWKVVAYCTNTAPTFLHEKGMRGADLVFVGREPGPEIAAYLVAVLNRAVDTSIAEFKAGGVYRRRRTDATRRVAVRDFTMGMVARLSNRLIEIFGPSIDKQANAVATSARDERFSGAKPVCAPAVGKARFDDAVWSGWTAGSKVNLASGVGSTHNPPKQIGGAK